MRDERPSSCGSVVGRRLLLFTLVGETLGCATLHVPIVQSAERAGSGTFRAGATEVDVTPPAGMATWGHGPDALPSRGHRGRLRCRIIYVEDPRGERVVFMPCDFAATSANLQRAIASEVAVRVGLGADRLVMSATHTHGGPAHLFAAHNYSGLFSAKVRGYDEGFVHWLAARLARGIEDAHDTARPARVAWATAFINDEGDATRVIAQNRSLEAHCANTDPMSGQPSSCAESMPDAISEVEGRLDLLRIDVAEGDSFRPLALYASFPVHGTSVPNTNRYFEADLWGFAARYVEASLRGTGTFVAALANGAEGDVRPNYDVQGWDEARRLGQMLGARMVAVHTTATAWETNPTVAVAYRDLRLSNARGPEGAGDSQLCADAQLGRSAPGGSEEGRTDFYGRRWHEGMVNPRRRGCHSPAQRFPLGRLASRGFPEVAPLMAVGVGRGTVLAYPWEMTTTAGLRLRQRVAESLASAKDPVVLVGLANEYVQYVTTREEFGQQHYEGASTLYGPGTLEVLTRHLVDLAGRMREAQHGGGTSVEMVAFDVWRPVRRRVFFSGGTPTEPRVVAAHSGRVKFESHEALQLSFLAGDPSTVSADGRIVARVERRDAAGQFAPVLDALGNPLDDTNEDLLFEHCGHDRHEDAEIYQIVWIPGAGTPEGDYRIVVFSATGVAHPGTPVTFGGRRLGRIELLDRTCSP